MTVIHKQKQNTNKVQAWSSLVFDCCLSFIYPSGAPPWDSRPALILKLKDPNPNPGVVISVLATIGELAQVALWTLGQQVASTGYVVEPYRKYPSLLEVLLNFLKTEQNQGIRREAIRVLGQLGALDPYKHKVNIGMIDQSCDASAVSLFPSPARIQFLFQQMGMVVCFVKIHIQPYMDDIFTLIRPEMGTSKPK
ncbi:serine/threonine-protein kinase mTOR-like isoform X1 [Cyprinus carpio]|uniref:Serine/threonine-protein kinase TOR n=1 Tax=Cyprinus carpio TaxID=7962 RepID=A0A9Q9WMS6_CYPCA|nr:serine/threonine-protein kinase mTOR-like isoform X1 [Cyprinus carpio]